MAAKNRIRNLVTHWQTDGEWKEAALRTIVRRHLPSSIPIGRGFVVASESASGQIDLLVLRPSKLCLFRDGELVLVTPDVPLAVVEVKTALRGPTRWYNTAKTLAEHGKLCRDERGNTPWLGVFVTRTPTLAPLSRARVFWEPFTKYGRKPEFPFMPLRVA